MLSCFLLQALPTSLPPFGPGSSWSVWLIALKAALLSMLGDVRQAWQGESYSSYLFFFDIKYSAQEEEFPILLSPLIAACSFHHGTSKNLRLSCLFPCRIKQNSKQKTALKRA